jgi:hypothetical protein
LAAGNDDDEVGYRLDDWTDEDRGRLIVELNQLEVRHRFEDDELVVSAEDEARLDDLLATLNAGASEVGTDDESAATAPEPLVRSVAMLYAAASRLREDPTDMHADTDVAEASAAVFAADEYPGTDAETWSAIGRVTRRLLAVLGADEALEEDIKREAGVLQKLMAPLVGSDTLAAHPLSGSPDAAETDEAEQTVYELPDWAPEQRAELGVLLDDAGIAYEWEMDELIVPADREGEVEELFTRIGGSDDDGEDEDRYQAVAELFAASGRLAADPGDEERAVTVLHWIDESDGPPLLGMNEVDWLMIMKQARTLAGSIEAQGDVNLLRQEASTLHETLRKVV